MGKDLDDETKTFFNDLANGRKKKFTIVGHGAGEFEILKRVKYKYKTQ